MPFTLPAGFGDEFEPAVDFVSVNPRDKMPEQAKNWAGNVLAELLGLDAKADRDQIKEMLASWGESGELEVVVLPDHRWHLSPHIEPRAT